MKLCIVTEVHLFCQILQEWWGTEWDVFLWPEVPIHADSEDDVWGQATALWHSDQCGLPRGMSDPSSVQLHWSRPKLRHGNEDFGQNDHEW